MVRKPHSHCWSPCLTSGRGTMIPQVTQRWKKKKKAYLFENLKPTYKDKYSIIGDFSGGLVAKNPRGQCRVPRFNPWSEKADSACRKHKKDPMCCNLDTAQPNK